MDVNPVASDLLEGVDVAHILTKEKSLVIPPKSEVRLSVEEQEKKQFFIQEDEVEIELPHPKDSIVPVIAEEDKNSQFGDYGESSGTVESSEADVQDALKTMNRVEGYSERKSAAEEESKKE